MIVFYNLQSEPSNTQTSCLLITSLWSDYQPLTLQSPKIEELPKIKRKPRGKKVTTNVKEEKSEDEEEEEEEKAKAKDDEFEMEEEVEIITTKTRASSGKRKAVTIAKPKPNKQVKKTEAKGGKKKDGGGT